MTFAFFGRVVEDINPVLEPTPAQVEDETTRLRQVVARLEKESAYLIRKVTLLTQKNESLRLQLEHYRVKYGRF